LFNLSLTLSAFNFFIKIWLFAFNISLLRIFRIFFHCPIVFCFLCFFVKYIFTAYVLFYFIIIILRLALAI
jgi:hypothetical protein